MTLSVKNWNPEAYDVRGSFGVSEEEVEILNSYYKETIEPLENIVKEAHDNKTIKNEKDFSDLFNRVSAQRDTMPNRSVMIYESVQRVVAVTGEEHPGLYIIAGLGSTIITEHESHLKNNLKLIFSEQVASKMSKEDLLGAFDNQIDKLSKALEDEA